MYDLFNIWPLRSAMEKTYRDVLAPVSGPRVDFTVPQGEPALVAADSISWQIYKNPITLFIGGVAAVLMELAEPRVGHGVWTYSDFRKAPKSRLQRTGLAAMVTIYGPQSVSIPMIAHIRARHEKVRGVTEDGQSYCANDEPLLNWVQTTASFGFLEAYHQIVRPVSPPERDQYYAETAPGALLYGAKSAPRTEAGVQAYFNDMVPSLAPSARISEFLRIMRNAPIMPFPGRFLQWPLIKAAIGLLPKEMADTIGVSDECLFSPWERRMVTQAAKVADNVGVKAHPAVQACQRLDLPAEFLFSSSRSAL